MYKNEAIRKAEILEATPALAEYLNDIPTQKAEQAFSNMSFRPDRRAFDCQLDYAMRLNQQKNLVLGRIESAQQNGAILIEQALTNGIEIKLSEDGKIEIHFGYKPDEQTRRMLGDNSFKFSRYRNNAWVRKFTPNAQAVFSRIVKPALEKLPQK